MAVPNRPLEITLDVKTMTLRQLGREVEKLRGDNPILAMLDYLEKYSNWTAEEIDAITVEEGKVVTEAVAKAIGAMVQGQAVPLES